MQDDFPTIPHLVLESAWRFEDKPAIVPPDAPPVTYAQLGEGMLRAARAFLAAGPRRGDRVAIWAPNLPEWIIAALGAQAAGGALVPLNTRFKGAEAAYILRASGARLLLTVANFLGNDYPGMIAAEGIETLERIVLLDGGEAPEGWRRFLAEGEAISPQVAAARLDSLGPDDVSDVLYTSGTTGRPKGAVTTHGQNLAVYRVYTRELDWQPGDRLLAINPFFHSFGYKAGWLSSIMRGSTFYPVLTFDPAAALDQIERDRITLMPGPPTIFQSLLAQPLEGRDLSSLRLAVTGATIVPAPLVRDMGEVLGFERVLTAYGLTETCGTVTICGPDDDIDTIANTSGRPIELLELRVTDEQGNEVPRGTAGEIRVRGMNVMRGYLDDPEATARAIDAEGWLRTGDIGVQREDGCVRITDRSKDVYICGGFNVYPAEVELALAEHPLIAEAAVVGVPDERLGEVGHAFVVARKDAARDEDAARALIAWSRDAMANYKVPRGISFVDALPRNASGKVEKFKLKGQTG